MKLSRVLLSMKLYRVFLNMKLNWVFLSMDLYGVFLNMKQYALPKPRGNTNADRTNKVFLVSVMGTKISYDRSV